MNDRHGGLVEGPEGPVGTGGGAFFFPLGHVVVVQSKHVGAAARSPAAGVALWHCTGRGGCASESTRRLLVSRASLAAPVLNLNQGDQGGNLIPPSLILIPDIPDIPEVPCQWVPRGAWLPDQYQGPLIPPSLILIPDTP